MPKTKGLRTVMRPILKAAPAHTAHAAHLTHGCAVCAGDKPMAHHIGHISPFAQRLCFPVATGGECLLRLLVAILSVLANAVGLDLQTASAQNLMNECPINERKIGMVVFYYEADIPERQDGRATHIELGSRGETVGFLMEATDGSSRCLAELNVAEAKSLIEGLRDALVGRCGMTFEQWNNFCKKLEMNR